MDRIKDNISLDHMARLLVDVQQDSSGIVDSIISQHQRELLNLIFLGDAPNRNKVSAYHLFLSPLPTQVHNGLQLLFSTFLANRRVPRLGVVEPDAEIRLYLIHVMLCFVVQGFVTTMTTLHPC